MTIKSKRTMRLHQVGVLAVVALLACVDVVSATTTSKIKAHNFEAVKRSLTENRNDVLPTRLLRTNDLLNGNDAEERVFGFGKVLEAISSAKSKIKMNQNIRTWLKQGKDADGAFKLLQLDDKLGHVLSSKNIEYWSKFISMYNSKNRGNQVSMIDLLTARFGEAAVSKMLVSAKYVTSTEKLATKLQSAQVAGWINTGKSPGTVFHILKLENPKINPLVSHNLDAFINYLSVFNHRNPEKETTLLQVFTKAYGGEKKLVDWLLAAKRLPEAAVKGDKLEAALFMEWFKRNLSTDIVSKDVLVYTSSNWYAASSFLDRYNQFRTNELAKVRNAVQ